MRLPTYVLFPPAPPVFTYKYLEQLLGMWCLTSIAIFLYDGYKEKKKRKGRERKKKKKKKDLTFQFIAGDRGTGVCIPWLSC